VKIILGPSSQDLGQKVARLTNIDVVPVASKIFPDGEVYIRLEGNVEGEHAVIVHTTSPPQNQHLMQLAFIADACKREGAEKVTAVVPYLAYARQDKVFLKGETISIEAVARMLRAVGVGSLLTVNIHQEKALEKFPFPAKTVSAIPLLARYFRQKGLSGVFILAPDKGAMHIAEEAKAILGGECGHLEKQRDRYTGQINVETGNFTLKGETVIIIDDIISTGGTIAAAAKIAKALGAQRILVACVHALLIADAKQRILESGVEEIVGTDSVPGEASKVTLAPIISQEIKALQSA
jgi:ribose-phosphate pyrophosphokinase